MGLSDNQTLLTVPVAKADREAINAFCDKLGVSVSEYVRALIEDDMNRHGERVAFDPMNRRGGYRPRRPKVEPQPE